MNRAEIALYLYETVRRIPCSYQRQLWLACRAWRFVSAFFQENPSAAREDLTAAFGSPADFAQALLEYVDEGERAVEFRLKSWQRRAIVAALGGMALSAVACAVSLLESESKS